MSKRNRDLRLELARLQVRVDDLRARKAAKQQELDKVQRELAELRRLAAELETEEQGED